MPLIAVDVESDGPVPPLYSMVCFGAVAVDRALETTFYGQTAPISDNWDPEALAISGFSREQHRKFDDPLEVFGRFAEWLDQFPKHDRPVFISDNPCYDWQWINYYFHAYVGRNPFGFSGRRIGDMFAGFHGDIRKPWKQHRKTMNDHNPVNDAKGNAEALIYLADQGVKGILR